ncbi:MAG: hypothetical protein N2595_06325 [bacterium]|nr:hypothetical protein [bacterium]
MPAEQYSDANHIELQCVGCTNVLTFSLLQLGPEGRLQCEQCGKQYVFTPELRDKIQRFEQLLRAVYNARDMLGSANVGIAMKGEEVKVPYRLLLTRLNTMLTLNVGGTETIFRFRVEPLKMVEQTS